ncbi:MAG: hypothetical protein LiPW15_224 [Parcubacteria group bacterium LiPW_15]|nr:MAG: hypothetical protein LiPW15_224 [Parcubacteria group bacterium LiPW_15]
MKRDDKPEKFVLSGHDYINGRHESGKCDLCREQTETQACYEREIRFRALWSHICNAFPKLLA